MNKSFLLGLISLSTTSLMLSSPAWATCGGGGGGGEGGLSDNNRVYTVPWHVVSSDEALPKDGLILVWFPTSDVDAEASSLKSSRVLSLYSSQCLTLDRALPTSEYGTRFLQGDKLPAVVLASPDGSVVAKIDSKDGELKIQQVEALVSAEMTKRADDLKGRLEKARTQIKDGNKDAAIADFRAVYDQRCMFPRLGRDAGKELRKLGVEGISAVPDAPKVDAATTTKMAGYLQDGLKAEEAGHYAQAEQFYLSAHRLDTADATPLRYLGELYRHHIGDWKTARQTFSEILAMKSDPLSRAVALHGLGKMTIHEGEFEKGKQLMEQSLQVYPLAMAARNLAVYWNSEGNREKAVKYTHLAQALASHDPYNLVFAAALLAGNGHSEESLKIASENEALLPASYNLAAIYAQNGQKEKALAMLKRHFYQYERNQQVRSKEMMEARVDAVFSSIVADPQFLALTAGADNRLPMPEMKKQDN